MTQSFLLIFISITIATAGQLLLKVGMDQVGQIGFESLGYLLPTLTRMFTNPLIMVGLVCYAFSALGWLAVLSRLDLSYAYPMLAIMYVLIPLASRIFLGEAIPPLRWLGIFVVVLGVIIVSRT